MGQESTTYIDPILIRQQQEQAISPDSGTQAIANADAAATSFLDFQAKIDLVMSQLEGEGASGEIQTSLQSLARRVADLEFAIGRRTNADNSRFQTPDYTAD